ncbi:hypothetical protein I3843_02G112200 [Carya illinoinensis]|uniref:Ribosomal protein L34Ae n=1 Tax=Carya illinoinensis TaxID=32201 RepID=A0A8T1RED7_CARIL|nr:uncharacterized protein LOC122300844 isoform X2 [Carya illinoinensis]KAG6664954.1 hypothetical protein CIPAW_02G129200 [Carya illinoinensis]KAG7992121.1 hypothetical protein I3843_02G112200 [Carya illinoinensis]
MNFFKVKKFSKAQKPGTEKDLEDKPVPQPEEPEIENGGNDLSKSATADPAAEAEEDDDDDFITNEVKRRLKELRRNSFMVLIPEEESCAEEEEEEEEEEGETRSSDWRDVEAEARLWWGGFDAVYDKYCERMLFFDRMSARHLNEVGKGCLTGSQAPATPSPRSASKKLTSPLRCLSLKKIEEPDDETEHLQQPRHDPYKDIETAYVAQICLTWEGLHCQFAQLIQKIRCQPDNPTGYNYSAQQFQQFQVLLQRFIENEPFEEGLRAEIYARSRNLLPKLLQVPNIKGLDKREPEEESTDLIVLAPDLIRIIESSILTFHSFMKMEKKKSSGPRHLFGNHNQIATSLQQVQSSLEKKGIKLKELRKRSKGWKKKSWPQTDEAVQLFFCLIDVKILSRVLRMVRITKEQLLWCEEKLKKLDLSDGKLRRDSSPIFFPCQ